MPIPEQDAARAAARQIPGVPQDEGGPVFKEPWQARAFAIVLALHERKLFGWEEWAATLGDEIRKAQRAGDPDTGETYYSHWLAALERIVTEKGAATAALLATYHEACDHAADRTPHGMPIELQPQDFAGHHRAG
jgi:nitrile hydratase accessory protein